MFTTSSPRNSTVSSLITAPSQQTPTTTPLTPPLSATAIRISRDSRLFENHIPTVSKADRMTLLSWVLEEDNLKKYEVFKRQFYEDPDEYNYALSSLLGTLVFDVTPVTPSASTIGTFVAPNMGRRNALLPFQSALTEKWKAIGTVFQHSWMNALNKNQRDAMIMRSFLDTANINEDMANARRQSFDIRTSEFSGRGFFTFITEHTLQQSSNQAGSVPVSLPHTDGMVRIFKDWVEKSGMSQDDENSNSDALFKRSCALSLRDKCIYSRALFGTRLCLTVLEKWEQIVRHLETMQSKPIKPPPAIEYSPVTTVTEIETSTKTAKPKKKKKSKSAKKAKKAAVETAGNEETKLDQKLENGAEVDEVELNTDNESVAINFTDDTKSSGVSSPTGTAGEESQITASTAVVMKKAKKGKSSEPQHATLDIPPEDLKSQKAEDKSHPVPKSEEKTSSTNDQAQPPEILLPTTNGNEIPQQSTEDLKTVNNHTAALPQISTTEDLLNSETNQIPSGIIDADFPKWEDFTDEKDAEWNEVLPKRRKNQNAEKPKLISTGSRPTGKKPLPERRQSIVSIPGPQKGPMSPKTNNNPVTTPTKGLRPQNQSNRPVPFNQELPQIEAPKSQIHDTVIEPPKPLVLPSNTEVSLPDTTLAESVGVRVSEDHPRPTTEVIAIDTTTGKIDVTEVNLPIPSIAEPERTVADTISPPLSGKKKRNESKPKSKERSKSELESLAAIQYPPIQVVEPVNLEFVTFFCAHCHRPRSYHSSTECSLCGPRSTIRYCSATCQRADVEHWRLCGLVPFPGPCIIPESHGSLYSPRRPGWLTRALYRQKISILEQHNFDYVLFHPRSGTPKYKVIFGDKSTKNRFKRLLSATFEIQDPNNIILLYRVLLSHIESLKWAFSPIDLARQLFDEFGFDPTQSPMSKDLKITPQDWARFENTW